jgi:hypothetical protein
MSNDAPVLSFADAAFGMGDAARAVAGTMMTTMTITTRMRGGAG